jgi:neutral ceramidase
MKTALAVGAAECDITPPVGTGMVGSLDPRPSIGIDDPLMLKALVIHTDQTRLAIVAMDLATLPRRHGDACVRAATRLTGIPADHIIWCTSHTHTGPIAEPEVYPRNVNPSDLAWLKKLPAQFAHTVARADAACQPARMSRVRTFCHGGVTSRRLRFKNGRDLNLWNLEQAGDVQSLGYASHPDPEVGALCFDDLSGQPVAILWTFACHTNANFGPRFSADYPAVTAARLRERYGLQTISVYLPGASGDINPILGYRDLGNRLAEGLIAQLDARKAIHHPVPVQACRREITIPARAFRADEAQRRRISGWAPELIKWFEKSEQMLKRQGKRELTTWVQAFRIGDISFVTQPGELFVEWGLELKAASPFPWTYPVELSGDYLGYLVTPAADTAVGYESLHSWVSRVGPDGVGQLVTCGTDLLQAMWKES